MRFNKTKAEKYFKSKDAKVKIGLNSLKHKIFSLITIKEYNVVSFAF